MKLPGRGGLAAACFLIGICACRAESPRPGLWPSDQAKDIPADTPLVITFQSAPDLGSSGKITVSRLSDGKAIDVLDFGTPRFTDTIGGKIFHVLPVTIEGNRAFIRLHSHALLPSERYRVTVTPDLFRTRTKGSVSGMDQPLSWTFSTRPAIPRGKTELTVASDGSGDFCSLQGAVDYVNDDNQTPIRILIKKGFYTGIVYVGQGKNHLRFRGEDQLGSVVEGFNNNILNPGRTGRSLLGIDANDCVLENMSVINTTPYKGSQAEAVRINGDRCKLVDDIFRSDQDTLLLGGRIYVRNCSVEGDVDFIWGEGAVFFESCVLNSLHNGYYVQSRNPEGKPGYVFSHCKLTASPGTERCWLARIETDRFPFSSVVYLNCSMGPEIPDRGWEIRGTNTAHLDFAEFRSTDLSGKPLDVSHRAPFSKQLSPEVASKLSDPKLVLSMSDSWDPTTP